MPRGGGLTSRVAAACFVGSAALAGCFQEIDSGASSASTSATPTSPPTHTVDLTTPAIGFGAQADAQQTDDPCTATTFHAMATLRAACAPCHGGGPGQNLGQPPFDYVLDVSKLLTAVSSTVKDAVTMQPVRFLVPGDPDHSRVYVRMFKREMPPGDVVGLPLNPNRPTVSDVSVIRQWISHCLGTNASDGQDDGQNDRAPTSSDAAVAPIGEVDAAAAADRAATTGAADARGAEAAGADGGAGSATDGANEPPLDGGAADGVRRRDGGVGDRGAE
jgi:hypothetical protein